MEHPSQLLQKVNKMVKNIFFDFDGVILDSVKVKSEAFFDLYRPHGKQIANKVLVHHEKNGGMSRFEKFPLYHKSYLNIKLSKDEIEDLSNNFSELVIDKVVASKRIDGVLSFLKKYYRRMNFWIITGTPTNEIKLIINRLSFDKYFIKSYGSPQKRVIG